MSVIGEILGHDINGLPLRKGDKAFFVEQPPVATAESKPIERPVTITGAPGTNSVKRPSVAALADGQVEVDVADFDGDYMTCPPGKLRKAQIEANPEEDDEWQAMEERRKQARYQDAKGEDWIDEFARTATAEEFRGAMRFTIGKYNRRMGKKDDLVSEITKIRDYCERWLEYERAIELEGKQ